MVFSNVGFHIVDKMMELQCLMTSGRGSDDIEKINTCRKDFNEWKKRAKDFWVREGDKNSRYSLESFEEEE